MTTYRRPYASWQLAWGFFFIITGLLLLFDRFYIFSFAQAVRLFWPAGMIALGISKLLTRKSESKSETQDNAQSPTI
jgi:hypothetical protein